RVGRVHGSKHKLTRPSHPWTNGRAERLNRTVKDATVKAYHDATHADPEAHGRAFVAAYTFAKQLKALRWRTPFQAVCDVWTNDSQAFRINPHHRIPEPNTYGASR